MARNSVQSPLYKVLRDPERSRDGFLPGDPRLPGEGSGGRSIGWTDGRVILAEGKLDQRLTGRSAQLVAKVGVSSVRSWGRLWANRASSPMVPVGLASSVHRPALGPLSHASQSQAGTFGQKAMFATGSEAASASSIQATVRLLGWAFPAPEATPLG